MKKRGLSPVVATILLVAMVIIIALIVFLWFRGISEEVITKLGGENIKLVCEDVAFNADYYDNTLAISNQGSIPIFGMELKVYGSGSHVVKDLRALSEKWPEGGLNEGGTFSDELVIDGNKIVLIPVLIGDSQKGKKTYICDEKKAGFTINL